MSKKYLDYEGLKTYNTKVKTKTDNLQNNITALDNGTVKLDDALMPTNPFGGRKLYINSIDNTLASADKKFYVTVTTHKINDNGITYPYIDSTKTSKDDNYFVDGPVVSTLDAHTIFDGSYETNLSAPPGQYIKVHMMFGTNTSPSATQWQFPGYPYGTYYLSYYYTSIPSSPSKYRVYNTLAAHGIGWHEYTATVFNNDPTKYIEQFIDGGNYGRTCIEFIIFGKPSGGSGNVQLSQVEQKLIRPYIMRDASVLTKYGAQTLYHDFRWENNHEETAKITAAGVAYAKSFYENGTAIGSKYASKTDLNSKIDKVSGTGVNRAYCVDGSGNTKMWDIAVNHAGSWQGAIPTFTTNTGGANEPTGYLIAHTPSQNYHVANKKYVDDAVAGAGGGGKLYKHKLSAIFYKNDEEGTYYNITTTVLRMTNTQLTEAQIKTMFAAPQSGFCMMFWQGWNMPRQKIVASVDFDIFEEFGEIDIFHADGDTWMEFIDRSEVSSLPVYSDHVTEVI